MCENVCGRILPLWSVVSLSHFRSGIIVIRKERWTRRGRYEDQLDPIRKTGTNVVEWKLNYNSPGLQPQQHGSKTWVPFPWSCIAHMAQSKERLKEETQWDLEERRASCCPLPAKQIRILRSTEHHGFMASLPKIAHISLIVFHNLGTYSEIYFQFT